MAPGYHYFDPPCQIPFGPLETADEWISELKGMTDPQRRQRLRILLTYVMEMLSTRLNVAATPEALLDALIKAPVDAHLLHCLVWGIGSDVEAFFKHGDY